MELPTGVTPLDLCLWNVEILEWNNSPQAVQLTMALNQFGKTGHIAVHSEVPNRPIRQMLIAPTNPSGAPHEDK